jgi:hypothetical protein
VDVTEFNHTLDKWIEEVEQRDFVLLCAKPSATSWSLGQLTMHLIEATMFYLAQAETCLSSNDNAMEEMSPEARLMFGNNAFPDELIEGPPSNANTPQPESKLKLIRDMRNLKDEVNRISALISVSSYRGKTRHPGLRFFNAAEWFQFAEMHFRHTFGKKKG